MLKKRLWRLTAGWCSHDFYIFALTKPNFCVLLKLMHTARPKQQVFITLTWLHYYSSCLFLSKTAHMRIILCVCVPIISQIDPHANFLLQHLQCFFFSVCPSLWRAARRKMWKVNGSSAQTLIKQWNTADGRVGPDCGCVCQKFRVITPWWAQMCCW